MSETEIENEISCPLCGHRFNESELECHTGCPMGNNCGMARCPKCGHEIVKDTRTVKWIKKLFRRS